MVLSRRESVKRMAGGVAAGVLHGKELARKPGQIKAIAFDAFAILDPRPIFARAEDLFPGRGTDLSNAWRTRQFEYQWLRALAGRYADFRQATEEALVFAARSLSLELGDEKRGRLMAAYLELKAWPDAERVLKSLKDNGLRLAFLSNATPQILAAGIANSRFHGLFDHVLSTDSLRTYKPDPKAYQLGVDAIGLGRDEIAFVAFAGWDASGAKWFGYPTYWANRLDSPAEELGVLPDAEARDMGGLLEFVRR